MKLYFSKVLVLFFSFLVISEANSQYNFSQLDKVLQEKHKSLGGKLSMLVYKDGKIVYEKNIGGYTKSTQEPVASCSKWITAAMVMTFVDEGKLSLEDTIGKFLPVFTKNKKGKIKIWQCLSHTTGIQGEEISLATLMNRNKYSSLEQEVNDIALKPLAAKPGDEFFYGSLGINIAGRILEVISNKDFETLFQERIGKPLQMTSSTFKNKHSINPAGGILSTASDYMNFLVMILNKGEFKGKRILKTESVEKMEKNWTEKVKTAVAPEDAVSMEYALGAWILEMDEVDDPSVLSSPGLFGTFPYVDISGEYAAILFVNTMNFKTRKQTYAAIKDAVDLGLKLE